MQNGQFLVTRLAPDAGEQTPLEQSSSPILFPDLHMPAKGRFAVIESGSSVRSAPAEMPIVPVRYDQSQTQNGPGRAESMDTAVQQRMVQTYSDVKSSWNREEKKTDPPNWLVASIELGAIAVAAQLGIRYCGKNGVSVAEAINSAKSTLGGLTKTEALIIPTDKSLAESALANKGAASTANTMIPHIRTTERVQRYMQ